MKRIALTFDDGPSRSNPSQTIQIMDMLAHFGRTFGIAIPATFFVQGVCINPDPSPDHPVIRAHREGHLIANHSTTHPFFSSLSRAEMLTEIKTNSERIAGLGIPTPKYFRAPYGDTDGDDLRSVLAELGMTHVGWEVDSMDWNSEESNSHHHILKRVMEGIMKNDQTSQIILFHDGPEDRPKTVKVIEALVPVLVGMGCEFVRVDAIL